mmetsp:Transcript_13867/g.35771  ORF Transcript_13867/g.35771 Transcript_13867/m.35771 type:complete len:233 (-) Transcript_13867:1498-2196(-)
MDLLAPRRAQAAAHHLLVHHLHRVVLAAVALDDLEHLPEATLAEHADEAEVGQPGDDALLGLELEDVREVVRREERRVALLLDGMHRLRLRVVVRLAPRLESVAAWRWARSLEHLERRHDLRLVVGIEAHELHHAVLLDEVIVDAHAHLEEDGRLRLRAEILHIHPKLEHGERHRVRVPRLARVLLVGRLGHELAEDAHVRRVLEDLVDRDVGEVLAGDLVPVLQERLGERP